jgi:competence protein ComFB
MKYIDEYDLANFKNEAENLVFAELEKQLEFYESTICTCAECVKDMAALALNSVKPLYRHSILGALFTAQTMNVDEEYAENVRVAVFSAIKKVRRNPAHEVKEIGNSE